MLQLGITNNKIKCFYNFLGQDGAYNTGTMERHQKS